LLLQRGGMGDDSYELPNSCRHFSHSAFCWAMNWINSGACLIRFRKGSRAKSG
jgi:hypothetical protein